MSLGDGARRLGNPAEWFDVLTEPFFGLLGPLFPFLVGVCLMGMLYIFSGSLALPTVLAILLGGGLTLMMPPEAQLAAQLLILTGVATGLYMLFGTSQGGRI